MRLCVALLLVLSACLLQSPASAQSLPTADELIAKHAAAVGAAPKIYRETIVSTGTLGSTKTMHFQIGDDYRDVFERGGLHTEEGSFKGEGWSQNANGITLAQSDDPATERADNVAKVVTRVTTPVDAFVVSQLNPQKYGTRTFYDPATYMIVRRESIRPTATRTYTYEGFAKFGARTLAKRWTESSPKDLLEQHYDRAEYVENDVVPAEVEEPGSRRTLVEFPPGVTDVKLPAHFVQKQIDVGLTIGGRTVDFTLDSGASTILMDPDLAKQLGLPLINKRSEVAAQRFTGFDVIVPEIHIGSLVMKNIAVSVAPMPAVHPDGTKPMGLLGFDFLAQLGVTIDYEHQVVSVTPAESFKAPAGTTTYPLDVLLDDGIPTVSIKIGKTVAKKMMFDTGFVGELIFFDEFARRNAGTFGPSIGEGHMFGVGGRVPVSYYNFPTLDIGNIHFREYEAATMPSGSYDYEYDGLIGTEMLRNFTVSLDYTNARVYLTLNAQGATASRRVHRNY